MLDKLNSFLGIELAAVAGYQKALSALKKKAVVHSDHLLQLASDHQRTVAVLQGTVHARGGVPAVLSDPWVDSVAAAFNGNGYSALKSRDFVDALLAVETRGLAEYEASLSALDDDARELVELELIPRQQRHIAQLSAMLVSLAA